MDVITCPRCLYDLGRPGGDELSAHTASVRCTKRDVIWGDENGPRRDETGADSAADSSRQESVRRLLER